MRSVALTLRYLTPMLLFAATQTLACDLPRQGNGRVAAVIDARTLRLDDGREVRLTGLAPFAAPDHAAVATTLLTSLVARRPVTLHAANDAPDRYGRQPASVRLDAEGPSVQAMLAALGGALADGGPDTACDDIRDAEADARRARRGVWRSFGVIKSAESRDELLAARGQFALVEGRVASVRATSAVTYVNFGRRWTRDFAVTISGKTVPSLTAAGPTPDGFAGKRLRVRGFIAQRGGPDGGLVIAVTRPEQIEIVGATDVAGSSE